MTDIDFPTSHEDLMDIASRWAYDETTLNEALKWNSIFKVNGVAYQVVSVNTDMLEQDENGATPRDPSGLDAYTLRNVSAGELTVAFVGSEQDEDWSNNAVLGTDLTPAQFIAAEKYVNWVTANFGQIDFACGNSLGGGLASYVGAKNGNIEVVTVNPAPVPKEVSGFKAPNVHNYINEYSDVLHGVVTGAGMQNRIIGSVTNANGTRRGFGNISLNHIGSERDKGAFDFSMNMSFSLFHPDTVIGVGGFGPKVDITPEVLANLSRNLTDLSTDMSTVLPTKLGDTRSALEAHVAGIDDQEQALRDAVREFLVDASRPWTSKLEEIQRGVNDLKRKLQSFDPPGPLNSIWDGAVGVVFEAINKAIKALQDVIDFSIDSAVWMFWETVGMQFTLGSRQICQELITQNEAVHVDCLVVVNKCSAIAEYTERARLTLGDADAAASEAIRNGAWDPPELPPAVTPWPNETVTPFEGSLSVDIIQWVLNERNELVNNILSALATGITSAISDFLVDTLDAADTAIEMIEIDLALACGTLRTAITLAAINPITLATGHSGDMWRTQEIVGKIYDDFKPDSCHGSLVGDAVGL